MTVTVKHSKTNAISDWTQAQLDEQIALGNFAEGTVLADIVLPSDWNDDHTLTGVGTMAEQDANSVAITGGTATLSSVTTPSVTATTNDLTLSAISTGNVNLATLGGTQFKAIEATGSVNVWNVRGGDGSTTSPRFTTEGTGTNIAGQFNTKGTGALQFFSGNTEQMRIANTASAVNYVQVTGSTTTNAPSITAQGSDSGIALTLSSKGAGNISFWSSGSTYRQFVVLGATSSVNYLQASGSVAGNAVSFSNAGTDTNISMAFQPKGTGAINLAAGSRGVNISNGGTVTAITRTAVGTGYTTNPTVVISAPTTAGGVQATATIALNLNGTPTIVSGGTGYTVNDVLTISGGTSTIAAQLTVTAVSGGVITTVSVTNGGSYTAVPANNVSVTGGTGTGATFTAGWGIRSDFTITNAGSGYIEQPTVTFSGGGGSGAAAYATVGSMPIIRSLAGSAATGDSLSFYTPAGESVRIRDQGVTSNGYVQLQGSSATSNGSYVTSSAGSLYISCAGTNAIGMFTNGQGGTRQFNVTHTASAVNYVQVTGATTLNPPVISSQGSDSTIAMIFQTKGGQNFRFFSAAGSAEQFRVIHTAGTIANYAQATGNVAGSAPSFSVNGSDTNIDLALTPKGTGLVRFGTYVAGALTATGYINIKAADGTTYKVLVST